MSETLQLEVTACCGECSTELDITLLEVDGKEVTVTVEPCGDCVEEKADELIDDNPTKYIDRFVSDHPEKLVSNAECRECGSTLEFVWEETVVTVAPCAKCSKVSEETPTLQLLKTRLDALHNALQRTSRMLSEAVIAIDGAVGAAGDVSLVVEKL